MAYIRVTSSSLKIWLEMFYTLVVGQLSISAILIHPIPEVILALQQIRTLLRRHKRCLDGCGDRQWPGSLTGPKLGHDVGRGENNYVGDLDWLSSCRTTDSISLRIFVSLILYYMRL